MYIMHIYFLKRSFLAQILKKFWCLFIFPETELSISNIQKKIPIFSQKKVFLIFGKWDPALFSPSLKNKRTPPRQIYYTFGNPDKISCFFTKENFYYVSRNGSPDEFFYFNGCIWIKRSHEITSLIKALREVFPSYHSHILFMWYMFLWLCCYITPLI